MSGKKTRRPSWHPDDAGPEFATFELPPEAKPLTRPKRSRRLQPDATELAESIRNGDRAALARAISLVESNNRDHINSAGRIIEQLLPETGKSWRIGISGIPGAGKSTLLEALGTQYCDAGHKVAVLAIDPTSPRSGGSILGDRIRMPNLSRHSNAYIRPTPSGGILGGVARKTRETILLCEAAGYDIIFIETMGVGQGEFAVREMVDCFVLLTLTGGGDDIQGIKRGILELSDIIAVNKADGDNRETARTASRELQRALEFLQPATPGWKTTTMALSGRTPESLDVLRKALAEFFSICESSGQIKKRRAQQNVTWMETLFFDELQRHIKSCPDIGALWHRLSDSVQSGSITPTQAVSTLLDHLTK